MGKKEDKEETYKQAYNGADCATTEPIETGKAPGTESKEAHDAKTDKGSED